MSVLKLEMDDAPSVPGISGSMNGKEGSFWQAAVFVRDEMDISRQYKAYTWVN
jgi:hypothetical protein